MKTLFLILTLCTAFPSYSLEFLSGGEKNLSQEELDSKKWIFNFSYEYLEYPTSFPEFNGEFEKIGEDKNNTSGIGLYWGREINFSKSISAIISLGGFYNKTTKKNVGQAAEDIDLDLSTLRNDYTIYGGEGRLSLNYAFFTDSLIIKPFLEVSAGKGNGTVETEYINKGVNSGDEEEYDVKVSEEFLYGKASVGIMFMGTSGLISYFKLTNVTLNKTSREVSGSSKAAGGSTVDHDQDKENIDETENSFSGSVGMGYIF